MSSDIVIEITGLKSLSKFIGLEDTPLYYDNGKFFKVEDNKIVYADIEWKDISGDIEEAPQIVDLIEDFVKTISGETIQGYIEEHNSSELAHPYIQNVIQEEISARTEADNTLQNNIDAEASTRQGADITLQNNIDAETSARQNADTTLQNNINTEALTRQNADTELQNNIDTETSARQNADTELQNNIDELTQTVEDNNTAVNNRIDKTNDTVSNLSDTVTSNYNTLNGKIDTEISNRTLADTTLQNNINAEALTRQNADVTLQGNIDALSDTVSSNYNDLSDQIDNLSDTVSDDYTDLDGKISDLTTIVNDNDTAINSKVDGINTTLTTSINNLSNTVSSNYTTLDTKIDNTKTSLEGDISDLSDTVSQNYTDLNNAITTSASTINSRIDGEVSTLNTAISTETANRQNADNNLQSQIDAIVSSSDVFDIVGTYAELQAYDISTVPVRDIVKVLVDSSHNNAATYYRCIETEGVKSWSYIGSEGAYYTKSESDTKFVAKTTTINDKPLSSNITLTASDVNALPNTTTIEDLTTTAQQNALNSGATSAKINQIATNTGNITTNANAISTINGKIPADASSSNKLVTASVLSNAVVDLANQDLSNLTETGNNRLHALKCYSDNGEVLTDAKGLADVKEYAHSTFDRSKFATTSGSYNPSTNLPTLVGSDLVLTDDGILKYSEPNWYVGCQIVFPPSLIIDKTKSWKIRFKVHRNTWVSGSWAWGNSNTPSIITAWTNAQNNFISMMINVYDTDNNTNKALNLGAISNNKVGNNTTFYVEYEYDGTNKYSAKFLETDGTVIAQPTPAESPYYINDSYYNLIALWATLRNGLEYDIKEFTIINDGVEVFSGNKTGIDTIKPDDYTVVGTPTISADGIASGFSSSNAIKISNVSYSFKNSFKISSKINYGGISDNQAIWQGAQSGTRINDGTNLFINKYGYIKFHLRDISGNMIDKNCDIQLPSTGNYEIDVVYTHSNTLLTVYVNGKDKYHETVDCSTAYLGANIFIGRLDNRFYPASKCSIDLNSFKIYVDGNLVYQPCLKIPYTQSKTGSKIVNAVYRDRVNDMASQFGYASYYTLDEDNGNFTLPQVELYGLTGDKTLRDSYYNGATYWELYSNRRLEQGGSCESGVEYTFPKPFADTNYILTIPYSSKTATSFIPSATGDFIAKGTGLL